jgi:hypothetical protein
MKQLICIPYGNGWDLVAFQAHYQFSIGLGFNIAQNVIHKNYAEDIKYRCLSFTLMFFGLSVFINIPLYKEK